MKKLKNQHQSDRKLMMERKLVKKLKMIKRRRKMRRRRKLKNKSQIQLIHQKLEQKKKENRDDLEWKRKSPSPTLKPSKLLQSSWRSKTDLTPCRTCSTTSSIS